MQIIYKIALLISLFNLALAMEEKEHILGISNRTMDPVKYELEIWQNMVQQNKQMLEPNSQIQEEVLCFNNDKISENGNTDKSYSERMKEQYIQRAIALMKSGAPANDTQLQTCFWEIASIPGCSDLFRRLMEYGLDPNYQDFFLGSILNRVINNRNRDNVEILLQFKANPNLRENCVTSQRTPLETALSNLSSETYKVDSNIILMLIGCGADPSSENSKHESAIVIANKKGFQAFALLMEVEFSCYKLEYNNPLHT